MNEGKKGRKGNERQDKKMGLRENGKWREISDRDKGKYYKRNRTVESLRKCCMFN